MSSVPSAGQCVCEDVTCFTDTLSWAEGQGRSLGQCECACAYVMTRVGASAVSSPCGAPRRSPPMEGALDLGVRLVAVSCSCVGVAGSSCWWLRRAPRASRRISVCWHRPSSRTVAYPGQARAWEPSRDGSDTSLERAAVEFAREARNNTDAYRMSNIGYHPVVCQLCFCYPRRRAAPAPAVSGQHPARGASRVRLNFVII